jgi:uncharacterized protein YecA (UPF0149 family)
MKLLTTRIKRMKVKYKIFEIDNRMHRFNSEHDTEKFYILKEFSEQSFDSMESAIEYLNDFLKEMDFFAQELSFTILPIITI